jgi:hypothetical protein
MAKEIVPIINQPQGSLDKNSTWIKCCYHWAMQLCVHFGIDIDLDSFLEEVNDFQVPPCFDPEQLFLLSKFGIGRWDETHKQYFIGNFREGKTEQH